MDYGAWATDGSNENLVQGNYIEGENATSSNGIQIDGTYGPNFGVVVSNNTVLKVYNGIRLVNRNVCEAIVSNNHVKNINYYGVECNGTSCSVVSNTFYDVGRVIRLSGVDCVASGNSLGGPSYAYGIQLEGLRNQANNNTIVGGAKSNVYGGITLFGSHCKVAGNTVTRFYDKGIDIKAGANYNEVCGNTLMNNDLATCAPSVAITSGDTLISVAEADLVKFIQKTRILITEGGKTLSRCWIKRIHWETFQLEVAAGEVVDSYTTGALITNTDGYYTKMTYGINVEATATGNRLIDNSIYNVPVPMTDLGTATIIKNTRGYVSPGELHSALLPLMTVMGDIRGLWPMQERTGVSATDYGPNGNTLTIYKAVETFAALPSTWDRLPYYNFVGTSYENLVRADDSDFSFGNGSTDSAFSIICVFEMGASSIYPQCIIGKWNTTSGAETREWLMQLDSSKCLEALLYDDTANAQIGRNCSTPLTAGTRYVCVVTYDGGSISAGIKVYLNGVRADDTDDEAGSYVAMNDLTAQLTMGCRFSPTSINYFVGKIGLTAVCAKELTAAEVWNITQFLKGMMNL